MWCLCWGNNTHDSRKAYVSGNNLGHRFCSYWILELLFTYRVGFCGAVHTRNWTFSPLSEIWSIINDVLCHEIGRNLPCSLIVPNIEVLKLSYGRYCFFLRTDYAKTTVYHFRVSFYFLRMKFNIKEARDFYCFPSRSESLRKFHIRCVFYMHNVTYKIFQLFALFFFWIFKMYYALEIRHDEKTW